MSLPTFWAAGNVRLMPAAYTFPPNQPLFTFHKTEKYTNTPKVQNIQIHVPSKLTNCGESHKRRKSPLYFAAPSAWPGQFSVFAGCLNYCCIVALCFGFL